MCRAGPLGHGRREGFPSHSHAVIRSTLRRFDDAALIRSGNVRQESARVAIRIFAHLTWTTWARLPLIDAAVGDFLGKFPPAECDRHGTRAVALGMSREHVHMLLELPAAFDVPRLVQ